MNAIGLIETKGLIPAIEAADVMLKTSQVELVERSFVGGGLVSVIVTGDVGAVKAAVDAGAAAASSFGELSLVTNHVIPRPHEEVKAVLFAAAVQPAAAEKQAATKTVAEKLKNTENSVKLEEADIAAATEAQEKTSVSMVSKESVKETVEEPLTVLLDKEALEAMTVKELRKLAGSYDSFGMTDKALSMANRATLLKRFEELR